MPSRPPTDWVISPLHEKQHLFRRQRLPLSDGKKSLSIAISPFYNHEQRVAIAQQIEAEFRSYPANAKPTKNDFIQALKTTPNTDPTNVGSYLWTEGWNRNTFGSARLAFFIQTKLGDLMDEVAELAQSMLYGELSTELQVILDSVKADPTRGLKIALGGSMSELEDHSKNIVSPFIHAITSEMLKDDSTPTSVRDVTNSSLSILGSKQGGVNIKEELLLQTDFNVEKDIAIIGLSRLYLAGTCINLRSMMASIVVQILLHHKCYNAKIHCELLMSILTFELPEGTSPGRVVVVEDSLGSGRVVMDNASLLTRRIEPANLLTECQDNGRIGKYMQVNGVRAMMSKGRSIRKEYEGCPRFMELANRVGYSN